MNEVGNNYRFRNSCNNGIRDSFTSKDEAGSSAFDDNGIVQKAITHRSEIELGDKIVIMADVCLCQFTSTGHCGIIQGDKIDNDIPV